MGKLEFPVSGNKKKTKNNKKVIATNNNYANTANTGNKTANNTGSSSLSSIRDFLGGSDKKVEEKKIVQAPKKEEKADWETVDSQGSKKEKSSDARNDVKPIVSKARAPAAVEEVYRPSKIKKNNVNEDAR